MNATVSRKTLWTSVVFAALIAALTCAFAFASAAPAWAEDTDNTADAAISQDADQPGDEGAAIDDPTLDEGAAGTEGDQPAADDPTNTQPGTDPSPDGEGDQPDESTDADTDTDGNTDTNQPAAPTDPETPDEGDVEEPSPSEDDEPAQDPQASDDQGSKTPAPVVTSKNKADKKAADSLTPVKKGSKVLPEGYYRIASKMGTSKYVMTSMGTGTSVNIGSAAKTGRYEQMFKLIYKDGFYKIVALNCEKALSPYSVYAKTETQLRQYTIKDTDSQWFRIDANDDGSYTLINKATGLRVSVTGTFADGNADMQLRTPLSNNRQKFVFTQITNLLDSGVYFVKSCRNTALCLDVKNATETDNYNVRLAKTYTGLGYRWYIAPVEGRVNTYTFTNLGTGKRLAVDPDSNNVRQRHVINGTSQYWKAEIYKGKLMFRNVWKGEYLHTTAAAVDANVDTAAFAASASEYFKLTSTDALIAGTYYIRFAGDSSMVASVYGSYTTNEANVQLESNGKVFPMRWKAVKNSDGTFTFVNLNSGKALEVKNGSTTSGTNVWQNTKANVKKQKWYVTFDAGGFRIASALNKSLVLHLSNSETAWGTNIVNSKDNPAKNTYRWTFKKCKSEAQEAAPMTKKAQGYYSATNWLLLVDTTRNFTGIYYGSYGNWELKKFWQCSTGRPDSPTVLGQYTVGVKGYSFGHGYTCYYYTQFCGDYLFHSVTYYEGTRNIMEGKMGVNISAGCVRLPIERAIWIYDNIPTGSKVVTYV